MSAENKIGSSLPEFTEERNKKQLKQQIKFVAMDHAMKLVSTQGIDEILDAAGKIEKFLSGEQLLHDPPPTTFRV